MLNFELEPDLGFMDGFGGIMEEGALRGEYEYNEEEYISLQGQPLFIQQYVEWSKKLLYGVHKVGLRSPKIIESEVSGQVDSHQVIEEEVVVEDVQNPKVNIIGTK